MQKRMVIHFTLPLLVLLAIPPRNSGALNPPEGFAPGPDVIVGDLPALIQAGSNGTQVGLALGTSICNNGDTELNFFALPNTDHPLIPQNLYRMSGGASNDQRFEQIGQSWAMHSFFALEQNACGFGCTASGGGTHLGPGCSNADSASLNGSQPGLGSRAWVNPYTGIFPATASDHTGHTHDGTTHRILVESSDLDPALNAGATFYGEAQLVTPHEYAWCQSHPDQCNMFNNVSYRQFAVTGTTNFTFSAVGSAVRTPAIFAWPGATIQTIEPEPGVDGKAFLAYKATQIGMSRWHYEYAIYNQNLDRGIRFFSVTSGCGTGTATNMGFHAPLNHPGTANDGTVGDAGYSNAPWTLFFGPNATWASETLAQNPNANALRWGTQYNFRFDAGPPVTVPATIGFFKTGEPVTLSVQGPLPECLPSPSPTATATVAPTPSPPAATPSPTASATATASPSPTICDKMVTQNFDSVAAPALPPGWSSTTWVASTTNPDTAPNCAFVDDPAVGSNKYLESPLFSVVSASASLSFRNNYDLEGSSGVFFDGGVLEISSPNINGGAFTDITDPAVGGVFLSGGYNGMISRGFGSQIAGRQAWSGNSGGYINSMVNLGPNVNGQTIRLKFRMVSDSKGAGGGWRIDTMSFAGICGIVSASPTPTATPGPNECDPMLLRERFDGVTAPALPPSWATSFTAGAADCTSGGTCASGTNWVTSAVSPDTFPNSVFHDAPGCVTDSNLDSPSFYSYGREQFLYFKHQYDLENGFDGAVLEISIRGGPFIDIIAAGGEFQTGGYNGTIATGTQSPIAGRAAWTGNSSSYQSVSVRMPPRSSLPPFGPPGVVLRFRLATDCSGASKGWHVDTIDGFYPPISCATPSPPPPPPPTNAINLSTRMRVQTGDNVGIGGFIITGSFSKYLLIRAIGPSLASLGVPGVLADPTLELHYGSTTVYNNNWRDYQEQEIRATGIPPTNDLESAMAVFLAPGAYTAIVRGNASGSGVALVEIYDINPSTNAKLANISTRALVDTGDNIVIAGFMLAGQAHNDPVVIRGLGPSLTGLGVPNALANPTLELRNSNGALLIANNDWQENPTQAAEITAAGLAPSNPLESAIAATLPPGAYTALLAGLNNGNGIGLVEIYDRGPP